MGSRKEDEQEIQIYDGKPMTSWVPPLERSRGESLAKRDVEGTREVVEVKTADTVKRT